MSHSKMRKRGYSHYLENWNPDGKKYVNTCVLCGHSGYSPVIEQAGFCDNVKNRAIYGELIGTMQPLPLDEFGRCEFCARAQDGQDGQDGQKE